MSSILQPLASPMLQQGMQGSLSVFANGGEVNDPFVMGLMEKYKHRMEKPSQYKLGGAVSENEPSIYVADLLAYTEGRLEGFWLDLSDYDSGAEVMERIQEFLDAQSKKTGELHEEYAIHDFENFPSELYSEYMTEDDFDKIISAYKVQNELDIPYEIILQVQREYGANYEQIKNGFFTKTTGDNEDKALGMAYVEIVGFNNIKNKDYYFDFTEYGSAIRSDVTNDEDEEESYAELSDYDLGEHYIELGGGIDNVSNKMLKDYFDYESFGNDLSIDDFESYRDGSDVYWFSKRLENGGKLRGDDDDDDRKEYSKAKKKVDAMSDDDVFEQIEDIYYYEMQDSDTSPEDLRNDIDGARKALIEFYAEDEDEDEEEDDDISVQPFNDGGMTKKYNSYEDFINDNIGSKKYVVVYGSGGHSQPLGGATKDSIEKQFRGMIYHEFLDSEFYYNYTSSDIKDEYISFIKEFYNSLLESPKEFASFWQNNMTKSGDYDSLYELKNKYKNIDKNYNYSTGDKRINSESEYVLAIKNDRGQTIKYVPTEKPESYTFYIFSKFKNKMSDKLKQEYIDYRKRYAGEDVKLNDGGAIKSKGTFNPIGSAKELGITPKVEKTGYDIYHNTLAATLDEINDYARRNGYMLGEFSREVGHISYGTTWRAYAPCMDDSGKQVNTIQVQIYRMDSGKYELNAYFDKKRKKKDDTEYLYDGKPLPFADGGEITEEERKNSRKNTPKLF